MSVRHLIAFALVAAFGAACNDSEFSGSARPDASIKPKREPLTDLPPKSEDSKVRPDKGKADGDDGSDDEQLGRETKGEPAKSSKPNTAGDGGKGSSGSLGDILGNVLSGLGDGATSQPNDNEVVFGGRKSFHIGDGLYSGSSCQDNGVSAATYSNGNGYGFEFEVKRDNVEVSLTLKVCGADYPSSNVVSVLRSDGREALAPQSLGCFPARNVSSVSKPFVVRGLAKGKYSLVVKSGRAFEGQATCDGMPAAPGDRDNFLIGEVRAKATGPIRPGSISVLHLRD